MSIRRMTFEAWGDALADHHGKRSYREYMGSSPGAAAVTLGCTRQRINQLVHQDKLDAIYLSDQPKGTPTASIITDASIGRLLSTRAMEQPELTLVKPKRRFAFR